MHQQVNRLNREFGLVFGQVLIKVLFFYDLDIPTNDVVPDEGLAHFRDEKQFLLDGVNLDYG